MTVLLIVILVVALVCFILAAIPVASRVALLPLGLAFLVLYFLVPLFAGAA